jgi:hypothetical protein
VNCLYLFSATVLAAVLFVPASKAQTIELESRGKGAPLDAEKVGVIVSEPLPKGESLIGGKASGAYFHKKQFLVLSSAVYAASIADMHQTIHVRNYSWWYETDPLAKPIVRLPAPAYYATGLALATGVNWLSWKMGHSRRWHKLAPLPQLLSIAGNMFGFKSNCYSNY